MRFRLPWEKRVEPELPLEWGDWSLPTKGKVAHEEEEVLEAEERPTVPPPVVASSVLEMLSTVAAPVPVRSVRGDWVLTEESEPGKDVFIKFGGVPGRRHHLTTISASFNQPWCGYLTLLFDTRKRMQWYVHNALLLAPTQPIVAGTGEGVMLYLHLRSPKRTPPEDLAGYLNLVGFTDV